MAQAKTLNPEDLEKVLNFINTQRHVERNRAMMLLTHWAGLRIGEVAALRWMDVVMPSGQIKDEIRLLSRMTKNQTARTVYVSQRLKEELKRYTNQARCIERTYPFLQVKNQRLKASQPTAWLKPLRKSTKALGSRALAVTVGVAPSSNPLPIKVQPYTFLRRSLDIRASPPRLLTSIAVRLNSEQQSNWPSPVFQIKGLLFKGSYIIHSLAN